MSESIFFVAEISANHLGNMERALILVEESKKAGASAVKLQTYKPQTMTLDKKEFAVSKSHPLWGGVGLFELYELAMTPWEWHQIIFQKAKDLDIVAFSTPFDRSAVDFLEELECPIYKVASMETGDTDLISYIAETGKPMIISTGASTLEEVDKAVEAASRVHNKLTLLVCTSSYPASASDAHLRRIETLRERFGVKVGVSDHTLGVGVSIAAIGLGASVIEKHITLKRLDGGPDAAFSMEPPEFKFLVEEGKKAFEALGNHEWSIQSSENESRRLRRSLFITKSVRKGDVASRDNIKALRPNEGGPINDIHVILGRRFKENFEPGDSATVDCVD
jgi:pseudaminic acid synthase